MSGISDNQYGTIVKRKSILRSLIMHLLKRSWHSVTAINYQQQEDRPGDNG